MQEEHNRELDGLIGSFHLMWDTYPGPCSLIHKSKKVVAVNPACKTIGREVGMICSKHGPPENHRLCRAANALSSHQAQRIDAERAGKNYAIFWLPIDGHEEYYLHFSVESGAAE